MAAVVPAYLGQDQGVERQAIGAVAVIVIEWLVASPTPAQPGSLPLREVPQLGSSIGPSLSPASRSMSPTASSWVQLLTVGLDPLANEDEAAVYSVPQYRPCCQWTSH